MNSSATFLSNLGFTVFPCLPSKQPRVPRGADWRTPREYEWEETDLVGVAVPLDTVVLDIDDLAVFRATGLEVTPSVFSSTRREGGIHIYYRSLRPVDQVTAGRSLGYDTRVGGKGYVIAWHPDDWLPVAEWGIAPKWLYETRSDTAPPPGTAADQTAPLGTRSDILSFLGRLAVNGSLTESDYSSILSRRLADGTITSLDPSRPWTDADLRKLAAEAAKWPAARQGQLILSPTSSRSLPALPEGLTGMNGADLLGLVLPPLQWRIDGLLPEGLGIIAAPPKTGKSVLAYQMAVELAAGGTEMLGCAVHPAPVLYYALEDGQRRSQSRVLSMLRDRDPEMLRRNLFLRWDAPRLGGDLEAEMHGWLQDHPGGLVIIDVLAKVRPLASSVKSKNAYDEDYDALTGVHRVTKLNPGSTILVVTHDRKAGSEDWMTRVTGTRGVTGAADFVMFINRTRGEGGGTLALAGRDVEDDSINMRFDVAGWTKADMQFTVSSISDIRERIYTWLVNNGPAFQAAIFDGLSAQYPNVTKDIIDHRIADMGRDGHITRTPGGWIAAEYDD